MVLLDTNALSEVLRRRPAEGFLRRLREEDPRGLAVSTVSVFELRHGCRRHPSGAALWSRIERMLGGVHILRFGVEESVCAGDIYAGLRSKGRTISIEDVMIGATAVIAGCPVVTRNVRHFAQIPGLTIDNWWD